jgi:outer membrane lipoprotein-sorting protein
MILRAAAIVLALAAQSDEAATAALKKLSEKMREARTLSARVVQTRRTELTDKPITSSGRMYYRRDPARLVFHLTEPRKAEIHMDRTSYQVFRPDEKRLERTDFGNEDVTGKILMMFEPKADELGKTFAIRGGEKKDGRIEVRLESSDEKVRKRLRKIVLTIGEADGALRSLSYTDGEGDDVTFDLSDVEINSALAPDLFALKVPEGTRVLRNSLPQDK